MRVEIVEEVSTLLCDLHFLGTQNGPLALSLCFIETRECPLIFHVIVNDIVS